uniref:ABC transmembrane type-2 domain-containing protein n=1 Tax=Izziella formosana TaxID=1653389 RepID=A0A1G4NV97_9FLOR|nr:Hypothetical protein ycf38 [Izziella formosana]SCW22436.1 Hypothetical protein ycf38 [Izziella formosana]
MYEDTKSLNRNNSLSEYLVLQPDFNRREIHIIPNKYMQEIKALTIRLIKQSIRRPSLIITGIIQPLLWLTLFSALFQNAPIQLFTYGQQYSDFVSCGMIVFTAFTAAMNSGLPIMFDREFGFFNRILSSTLYSRSSIIIASSFNIAVSSSVQIIFIILTIYTIGQYNTKQPDYIIITGVLFLLSNSITNISLVLAFILPGHIELLACILILNLPLLFSSTALAPLVFMPSWLQVLASLNPLTYAIETIRYTYLNPVLTPTSTILTTTWGDINFQQIFLILIVTNLLTSSFTYILIGNKFED